MHISVAPGASLTLAGCHLFSCPGNMWGGIVLNTAGGLSGQVILNSDGNGNSTLIEDALVAVDAEGLTGLPSGAANPNFVASYNTVFNKNNIGIKIVNYSAATTAPTTYPFLVENTVFTSRTLWTIGHPGTWPAAQTLKNATTVPTVYTAPYSVILYPTQPCNNNTTGTILTAGVYLNGIGTATAPNYGSVQVGYPSSIGTVGAPTTTNLFDALNYGIWAVNANATSINNAFAHITQSTGVTTTVPNNGGIGIYTSKTDLNQYQLTVQEGSVGTGRYAVTSPNEFWDCKYGVYSLNYYHVTGQYSRMVTTQSNATGTNSGFYGYNIQTQWWDNITISNNTIINVANGIAVKLPGSPYVGPGWPGQITINSNFIRAQNTSGTTTPPGTNYVDKPIWVDNAITYLRRLGDPPSTNMVNTDGNKIQQAYNGIHINGVHDRVATSNWNTITEVPYPALSGPIQFGISHANCAGNVVYHNDITGMPTVDTSWKGVLMYGCAKPNVTCNDVADVGEGFDFEATSLNARWLGNEMTNTKLGFVLGGPIGPQGDDHTPSSNTWLASGSFSWTGTNYQTYTVHGAIPTASPMWVYGAITIPVNNGSTIPLCGDKYGCVTGGPNGLNPVTSPVTIYMCESLSTTGIGTTTVSQGLVQRGLAFPMHRSQNYWNGQFAVYESILRDSALADTSAVFAAFLAMATNSRYALLTQIEGALASGDTAGAQTILNNFSVDSMANVQNDTATGVQMADDTTADAIVVNYRQYYQLYINYQEGTLSSSDSAALTAMANLCPITGGNVVFKARALYDIVYDTLVIFPDNCPDSVIYDSAAERMSHPTGVKAITDSKGQQYILYPNPNDGNFILQQGVADDEPVQAEVWDVTGRVLYKDKLQFTDLNAKMRVVNAVPGMYLMQLTDSKGQIFRFKFVVQ